MMTFEKYRTGASFAKPKHYTNDICSISDISELVGYPEKIDAEVLVLLNGFNMKTKYQFFTSNFNYMFAIEELQKAVNQISATNVKKVIAITPHFKNEFYFLNNEDLLNDLTDMFSEKSISFSLVTSSKGIEYTFETGRCCYFIGSGNISKVNCGKMQSESEIATINEKYGRNIIVLTYEDPTIYRTNKSGGLKGYTSSFFMDSRASILKTLSQYNAGIVLCVLNNTSKTEWSIQVDKKYSANNTPRSMPHCKVFAVFTNRYDIGRCIVNVKLRDPKLK